MTNHDLCRAARSLYYRRRLLRGVPQLEEALRAELCLRGLTGARLGGYIVRVAGDELVVEHAPAILPGQLRLPEIG